MCGLIFSYQEGIEISQLKHRASDALQKIAHRGPDGHQLVGGESMVMGHVRLAIIDIASSHQPMADEASRYLLAFNGEIYNYKELRQRLDGQWVFQTNGDTEVLLAGLIIYGEQFLENLEGMWAFAFWDKSEKLLLLGRDRIGKKPLYYQASSEEFICASELPALASLSDKCWEEDLDSTADYLRYGFYLPGYTAYRGVKEVLPGHTLSWKVGEQPRENQYWSLPLFDFQGTYNQAKQLLREKLITAVKRRLVSDVEVGAFLSGGIDSTLIVSIIKNYCDSNLKTFTMGFTDSTFDESSIARKVAQTLKTHHFEDRLENLNLEMLKNLIFQHIGQPFADVSLLPTAYISKLAASHVKVALSGDGGDELFSGYQRYQARSLLRWYTRLPSKLRTNAESLFRKFPEPSSHHSHSLLKKSHLFLDIVDQTNDLTPYVAPSLYSNSGFMQLAPELRECGHEPPALNSECNLDDIHKMMAKDALIYLPQDILTKVDRASMCHSLEVRAPFLDKEVIELAFSLPIGWQRSFLSGKNLLRNTFKDLIPNFVLKRRKQGFATPVHTWINEKLGGEIEELMYEHDNPISKSYVQHLLDFQQNKKRDHSYCLWNIYLYLLWKDRSFITANVWCS